MKSFAGQSTEMGTPQFTAVKNLPIISNFELALKPTDGYDAGMKNDFSHDIMKKVGNNARNGSLTSRKSSFAMNF